MEERLGRWRRRWRRGGPILFGALSPARLEMFRSLSRGRSPTEVEFMTDPDEAVAAAADPRARAPSSARSPRRCDRPDPEDPPDLRSVQHRPLGAGNPGQAIATSSVFADHGFRISAIFDVDPERVGMRLGDLGAPQRRAVGGVSEDGVMVGVLRRHGSHVEPELPRRGAGRRSARPRASARSALHVSRDPRARRMPRRP
jgi:hypothetical protein